MTAPTAPTRRVHLSRAKGARIPPGAIVITRASRWGNPYPVAVYGRTEAIRLYRRDLAAGGVRYKRWHITVDDIRRTFPGRTVACACLVDEACHGDVITAVAAGLPP